MDDFDKLMNECDLLITHGGVGSIISGLKKNKKVIAVARLAKYKEHMNDHQKQIVDNFSDAGYILKSLGYDEYYINLAKIAGYMHDIGNLTNRNDHSLILIENISPMLFFYGLL